ncbi:retroviral-like aspartic protease family protein [Phenylobacterium sp.]|uniref:retroviral-like aspartic protease family protein n=1 Tax=Phenylobacterium sp. TaxID=1871053 RepID=UPI00286BECF5|nr:retroviral-like aspartic protease family protein [Phenylobacterium sp.]
MRLPTRRQAAAGLLFAAGIGAPLARAWAQSAPREPRGADLNGQEPRVEQPAIAEEPATQIDTGRDRYEHMLAPVSVNGQGPFQFLIDTGANASCISRDLAQRLSLTALPPGQVHTAVGVRERPNVLIEHLRVGDLSRRGVHAPAMPFGKGVDGVLGVDWLKGQRLELGFRARSLAITRSRPDAAGEGAVIVPARRRLGQLTIVDADLGGQRINAMIDSGSQATICNAALRNLVNAGERQHGGAPTTHPVTLETLAGESFEGEMIYLPFMRLGGLHLGNVPVVYANMHIFDLWDLQSAPAVVLGMDVLTQFDSVALDFGRSQVRFDISQTATAAAKPAGAT